MTLRTTVKQGTILKALTSQFYGVKEGRLYVCKEDVVSEDGTFMIPIYWDEHNKVRYSLQCFKIVVEP